MLTTAQTGYFTTFGFVVLRGFLADCAAALRAGRQVVLRRYVRPETSAGEPGIADREAQARSAPPKPSACPPPAAGGPAVADVAHCRVNLLGFGTDAAQRFTALWQRAAGDTYHPRADVVTIIGFLDDLRDDPAESIP